MNITDIAFLRLHNFQSSGIVLPFVMSIFIVLTYIHPYTVHQIFIIVFFPDYHIGHLSKITTFSHLFLFLGSFINYTVWSSHIMSQGYYKVILLEEEQIGGFRTFIIIAWGNNIFVRLSVLLRKTMRSCRTDFIHCYALHIGLIFLYLIQCQNASTEKHTHKYTKNNNE